MLFSIGGGEDVMAVLSAKQELFVQEYLRSYNATQSAIKAGYSEKTARSQGQRLLTNVDVSKRLEEEMAKLRERMANDSNRAYALLWRQLSEVEELLRKHDEVQTKLNDLSEQLNEAKNIKDIQEIVRLENEIEVYLPRLLKQHNWVKAQELRTNLLQDILDRGGYKATDKLIVNGTITNQNMDLTSLSVEELKKLATLDE